MYRFITKVEAVDPVVDPVVDLVVVPVVDPGVVREIPQPKEGVVEACIQLHLFTRQTVRTKFQVVGHPMRLPHRWLEVVGVEEHCRHG